MDDKLKTIQDLKAQRKKIDEEIVKLTAEANAELKAITNSGRKPRKKKDQQQQLPLQGGT